MYNIEILFWYLGINSFVILLMLFLHMKYSKNPFFKEIRIFVLLQMLIIGLVPILNIAMIFTLFRGLSIKLHKIKNPVIYRRKE